MWPNWQAVFWPRMLRKSVKRFCDNNMRQVRYRHPDGKGWTLIMSDRFSGKVFPLPSGIASHGKWNAVRQKQLSGALRGATF